MAPTRRLNDLSAHGRVQPEYLQDAAVPSLLANISSNYYRMDRVRRPFWRHPRAEKKRVATERRSRNNTTHTRRRFSHGRVRISWSGNVVTCADRVCSAPAVVGKRGTRANNRKKPPLPPASNTYHVHTVAPRLFRFDTGVKTYGVNYARVRRDRDY